MQPQGKAVFSKCLVVDGALEVERLVGKSFLEGTAEERRKSVPSEGSYYM